MTQTVLYMSFALAAIAASFFFNGKKSYRDAVDVQLTALVTAQAERIALLEQQNRDQQQLIEAQLHRIDYLEELLFGANTNGNPRVVPAPDSARARRPRRKSPAANPPSEGDGGI